MENKNICIAGAGICCMDYIFVAPQVDWGGTGLVTSYLIQGGGLVATALAACARLGACCDFMSMLGDDQVGDQIVAELVEEGIPTDGIIRAAGAQSPFSFIHVDENTGERTIFHRPGTGLKADHDQHIRSRVARWRVLIVDDVYPDLALSAAQSAREHGVPVVADLVPGEQNSKLLKYCDVLIAPRHFARQAGCEDNLAAAFEIIHELGPATAVITLGSDGWAYSDPAGYGSGSAFDVEVVDTTGAGDAFHGAFAYGLAMGWDTARCAEFASAVAAIKCTKAGGRTGLPSLPQTIEFLKEMGGLEWAAPL